MSNARVWLIRGGLLGAAGSQLVCAYLHESMASWGVSAVLALLLEWTHRRWPDATADS